MLTSSMTSQITFTTSGTVDLPRYATSSERRLKAERKKYLNRPWLVIDGEGVTTESGEHLYIEFACHSTQSGETHTIIDTSGLDGYRILQCLMECHRLYPDHIAVIFGGSYDFNMWLHGLRLDTDTLRRVYRGAFTYVDKWRIKWRAGKNFYIGPRGGKGGMTVYDVLPFFQCSFVKACDDYLGDRFLDREQIIASKARRGDFTLGEVEAITEYNHSELVNLGRLATELRSRLAAADLYPSRWDGPGAIAAYLLGREKIKKAMAKCPDGVREAARYGYFGGRFELIQFGHSDSPCYEYDINSAYPAAMLDLPDLNNGRWVHKLGHGYWDRAFAIYHVHWKGGNPDIPGPFPKRLENGSVAYPIRGTGWYWAPEVDAALAHFDGEIEILESWCFQEDSPKRPFAFVADLYAKRLELKKAKNGANIGYKLALNSIYGKLAQQVGAKLQPDGSWRIPPFHQLEWAGYITSKCRATVYAAAMNNPESIIAFETDALFSKVPLQLDCGEGLGQFDKVIFDNLTYMQSGMYYADQDGVAVVNKTRGVDRGNLTREQCLAIASEPKAENRTAKTVMVRFHGLGIALQRTKDVWCKWIPVEKNVRIEPQGKREHTANCPNPECGTAPGVAPGWHHTYAPANYRDSHSCAFPVIWENPDPNMIELAELREIGLDDGYSLL